jgi:hypothetical protein
MTDSIKTPAMMMLHSLNHNDLFNVLWSDGELWMNCLFISRDPNFIDSVKIFYNNRIRSLWITSDFLENVILVQSLSQIHYDYLGYSKERL